jgi:hypothetical protein
MKKSIGIAVILSAVAVYTLSHAVWADSADATCEFYKHGDKKHDRWGPCSFSQRQGNIDITLKNRSTYNLSPRSEANHFSDQQGHKVVRTQAAGNGQVYEWEKDDQKIVVTFNGSNAGDESTAVAAAPASSTEKVEVEAMARYCAGEASAKFQQRPTNISTQPAIEDQGMYSVFGQYPPSGADPTIFICTFSSDGKLVGVDKQ